jgi:CRISPR-associated protein Cmr6
MVGDGANPGLIMDKLALEVPGQNDTLKKEQARKVVSALKSPADYFEQALKRQRRALSDLKAETWTAKTLSASAVHLARASVMENFSLCLHRTYGFPFLPGSGLKGMARAYAKTVANAPDEDVRRVFGFGATKPGEPDKAGSVVFHDAWPTTWPKVELDVLTVHHSAYYGGRHQPNETSGRGAPGDWESPIPVEFLTLAPGCEFQFAVSAGSGTSDGDLELAKQWLSGALATLGIGAKTSAGYGAFAGKSTSAGGATFSAELILATPAYFAGADQSSQDGCDLRGATLRGQLRWWWRTRHAAYLSNEELQALEAVIWGSSKRGGAVAIRVVRDPSNKSPIPSPFKQLSQNREGKVRLDFSPAFAGSHGIQHDPGARKTPGLAYLAYGMDELDREKQRKRRWCLEAGAKWTLEIRARSPEFDGGRISLGAVLEEVKSSLFLLCRYGGVGAKSRNGFGSIQPPKALGDYTPERSRQAAEDTRAAFGMGGRKALPASANTPCIEGLASFDAPLSAHDPWLAVHLVGEAAAGIASAWKHQPQKLALGLPRKLHGPLPFPLRHQGQHTPPINLEGLSQGFPEPEVRDAAQHRHPAPLFYSFRKSGGKLVVTVSFMPDPWLQGRGGKKDAKAHQAILMLAFKGLHARLLPDSPFKPGKDDIP